MSLQSLMRPYASPRPGGSLIPRFVLILVALLLVPAAQAAPVQGRLDAARGLELRGDVEVASEDGALDLSAAVLAGAPLALRFAEGEVERATYETRGVEGVWDDAPRRLPPERAPLRNATLSNFACETRDCVVLLFALEGRVGLRGEPSAPLQWAGDAWRRCGRFCGGDFAWEAPPGSLALEAGEDGAAVAEGAVGLFLRDASADLVQDGRVTRLEAKNATRPIVGGPLGAAYEGRSTFVVVRGDLSGLALPPGAPATLHARSALATVRGAFSSPSATGVLTFRGNQTRFEDAPLDVAGNVTLALEADAAPLAVALAPLGTRGPFEGDASRVQVGALVMKAPRVQGAAAVVALGGALALVLLLATRLALPLFSRIARADVLANANRARILAALREAPGSTRAQLARRLGLSQPVVAHHVRTLEAHRFAASRGTGRARGYFAVEDAPDAAAFAARSVLRDPTRRLVARYVAGDPQTQRLLVERTGLSQRLVSYHLARLERQGLVRVVGARPCRYVATDALRKALGASDAVSLLPPER